MFDAVIASASSVIDLATNGFIDGIVGVFTNGAILTFAIFVLVWSVGKKWLFGGAGRV